MYHSVWTLGVLERPCEISVLETDNKLTFVTGYCQALDISNPSEPINHECAGNQHDPQPQRVMDHGVYILDSGTDGAEYRPVSNQISISEQEAVG
jgi:hypothetical protein